MQKKYLLLIFSLLVFCLQGFNQNIHQTLSIANQLKEQNQFAEATIYYERVYFFDKSQIFHPQITQYIAECYQKSENYPKAIVYYEIAKELSDNKELYNKLSFNKTKCLILNHNYAYGLIELMNQNSESENDKQWNLHAGICSYGMEQYDDSKEYFLKIIDKSNSEDSILVIKLFDKIKKYNKRLNPNKAKIMSLIIPGLGQFYCGNIKNGVNSLLLNGLLVYFMIDLSITYFFVDALVGVGPWFQRYYMGGASNAERSAEKQMQKRKNEIYQQLMALVNT